MLVTGCSSVQKSIALGTGAEGFAWAYWDVKAMAIKIDKGLPPLLPYTEKLTGKKFSY